MKSSQLKISHHHLLNMNTVKCGINQYEKNLSVTSQILQMNTTTICNAICPRKFHYMTPFDHLFRCSQAISITYISKV